MSKTMESRFSPGRIFLLLRNRLLDEAPTLGIGLAVVTGLCLLGLLLAKQAVFNQGSEGWKAIIVVSGILLSSQAFRPMHDGKSGADWLLLPASPLEKYCAALLDYLLVFPLAAALVSMGLSALSFVIAEAVGGRGGNIWLPLDLASLKAWGGYAIGALVFIAGSAQFRKGAFLKTFSAVVIYGLLMAGLFLLAVWLVERAHGVSNTHFDFRNGNFSIGGTNLPASIDKTLNIILRLARDALLPIFAAVYGYFRVFEKEARDEVQ